MKKMFLFFLSVLVFSSCVTTPGSVRVNSPTSEIPSIQEKYQDRFTQTVRGMPLFTFHSVWPEALKIGETEEFAIYEFRDSTLYHTDSDYSTAFWWTGKAENHEYVQRAIFYFANDMLVRYETDARVVEINQ